MNFGVNLPVLIYFFAGILGGVARVYYVFGASGFRTPKLVVDAVLSAAGGVLYPYLVPAVFTKDIPILAIAGGVAALTYGVNHFFIQQLKRVFGYTEPKDGESKP